MNYYNVLGLKNTASQEEIKSAYKKLVKKYHPDIYKGDKTFAEKKTAEINVAYDVLSNPVSKKEYDEQNAPKYSYTPPKYDYNTTYNRYNGTYNSYTNYNETRYSNNKYSSVRDGSEHDYYTYANYEKKYSDYHRSKTPNSNYTSKFSSKLESRFDSLSSRNRMKVVIIIVFIFLFYFLTTITDLLNTLKKEEASSALSSSISSTNTYSYDSYNPSTDDFSTDSELEESTFDYENSLLSDYFTEAELKSLYKQYLSDINSNSQTSSNSEFQLTYDEYVEILETYLADYIRNGFTSNFSN